MKKLLVCTFVILLAFVAQAQKTVTFNGKSVTIGGDLTAKVDMIMDDTNPYSKVETYVAMDEKNVTFTEVSYTKAKVVKLVMRKIPVEGKVASEFAVLRNGPFKDGEAYGVIFSCNDDADCFEEATMIGNSNDKTKAMVKSFTILFEIRETAEQIAALFKK